jgi:hypothetical protein
MADADPNTEYVAVNRGGYPALVFVEFGPSDAWTATDVASPRGSFDHLDSRARGVLRSYAVDILRRLAQADALDGYTIKFPVGPLTLDPE